MDVAYNDPALFSLNGTKPDDFTNLTQFESFFTTSSFLLASRRHWTSIPSAMNMDGDGVANEYDELKTFATDDSHPLWARREAIRLCHDDGGQRGQVDDGAQSVGRRPAR